MIQSIFYLFCFLLIPHWSLSYRIYSLKRSVSPYERTLALRARGDADTSLLKGTSRLRLPLSTNVEDISVVEVSNDQSCLEKVKSFLKIVYKFCRPHTIKGTILASFMGVARALAENPNRFSTSLLPRAFLGLFALLCGNAYIVGINQIYDVKIDEINKPFLPIAAKSLSEPVAWLIVLSSIASGMTIVYTQFSEPIFLLYLLGATLGTLYSVPPVQLKRFPFFAGSIIACVRGFLLNFGVYYAVREALMVPFRWNSVVLFISIFMTAFASVIAVTKDLTDIAGDRKYAITTFATKFGVPTIAKMATIILSLAYVAAISLPFIFSQHFRRLPMILGHSLFLLYGINNYRSLNPEDTNSIKAFYKRIWNLFYLEYLLYPFI